MNFYNSYFKNYLKRITSTILTICLLVSNCLPVFAELGNVTGSGGSGTTETQADGKTPKFIRVLDFVKY